MALAVQIRKGPVMKKLLLALCLFLVAQAAPAHQKFTANTKRLVIVAEEIDSSALEIADRIDTLSHESTDPIDLVISSPGGSVGYGLAVVGALEMAATRGVTTRCAVVDWSASMAMMIFDHCGERYALPHSQLLWHDAAIQTNRPLRAPDLEAALADLQQFERYMQKLRADLKLDVKTFDLYRHGQVPILATHLKEMSPDFLTIVDDIENVPHLYQLKNPYRHASFFGLFGFGLTLDE